MTEQPVLATPRPEDIRAELLGLVVNDLHGPLGGPEEEFPTTREDPIDRYPLGRLAPRLESVNPAIQEDLGEPGADDEEDGDPEPGAPNQGSLHPTALGFTATVDGDLDQLLVTGSWARYGSAVPESPEHSRAEKVWRRQAHDGKAVVPLAEGVLEPRPLTEEHPEIVVRGRARRHDGNWLVTLFLENTQQANRPRETRKWIFQVELSAAGPDGTLAFLAREDHVSGGDHIDQWERRQLGLTYRHHREFAVGSGTAVRVDGTVDHLAGRAERITTTTVPTHEVPTTSVPNAQDDPDLAELADLELRMDTLAGHAEKSGGELADVLNPLVRAYRSWIDRQAARINDPGEGLTGYAEQARHALDTARRTAERIEAGIELVHRDSAARRAFGFANRAMHLQRVHTMVADDRGRDPGLSLDAAVAVVENDPDREPRWRPFQLAFVLLNLPSLANPRHPERTEDNKEALADLLWFPTGGGKTEAYLGLTAFTIAIRRLAGELGGLDATDGLAVLMRYTLRLLTLQQFERATTLICAAELLRREDPGTWGTAPIRIGLWVGGRVTPNTTKKAADWARDTRRNQSPRGTGTPHQLSRCPWCGTTIEGRRDIEVVTVYQRTLITCDEHTYPFSTTGALMSGQPRDAYGLPVLVVDEEIYRHPPALLIGTVDKFAQLPWQGQTSGLFGRVDHRCERCGYLTPEEHRRHSTYHPAQKGAPAARTVRVSPLRPPDLVIQDELHLISGPLGSLVGLYETAVDRLATWQHSESKRNVRPKVVASTATVRRADPQIGALFYRQTAVFPSPGLDVADNFFARQRPPERIPGRQYVGICAHGSRIRSTLIRVYVSVLGAAQRLHEKYGRNPVTDPYMTLVGYFNSLRDLGSMRRLVEDDVSTRLARAHERGLANRHVVRQSELTSRLSSDEIRPLLDRLAVSFPADAGDDKRGDGKAGKKDDDTRRPLDVLLSTNMIAVGVDVSRLGMMVVTNQPKSTAEYIQATSRVGRRDPGLIFTVYNWARPRDLSAYEHFAYFHANLYREVEALSVTPFADRAIDRGLFGVLASLVRHTDPRYNANPNAQHFNESSELADHVVRHLQRRAKVAADPDNAQVLLGRELEERLTFWKRQRDQPAQRLGYVKPEKSEDQDAAALLRKPDAGPWRLNTCPTSLRDVEPEVPLLMRDSEFGTGAQDEPDWQAPPSTDTTTDTGGTQ